MYDLFPICTYEEYFILCGIFNYGDIINGSTTSKK